MTASISLSFPLLKAEFRRFFVKFIFQPERYINQYYESRAFEKSPHNPGKRLSAIETKHRNSYSNSQLKIISGGRKRNRRIFVRIGKWI